MSGELSNFSAAARAESEAALATAAQRPRAGAPRTFATVGCEVVLAAERLAGPDEWEIERDRHTLIVHLDGELQRLETRFGRGAACRAGARAGEIWLVPAGARYRGRADGGTMVYAEFRLREAWLDELAGGDGAPRALRPLMKARDPLLHGLAGRLLDLDAAHGRLDPLLRESLLQTIGLHLLREYSASPRRAVRDEGPPRLAAAVERRLEDYILARLDQRLGLDELAAVAATTPHRLIGAFRAGFGQTPMQYVIARRLALACRLLESTRQDIASIALATGFSNHSHLTASFRRRYGLTPRAFRRRAKGIGD